MAEKVIKKCRLRYDKGDPALKGAGKQEAIWFEVWDTEHNEWCCISVAPFRRSVDFPNADEPEFIHWSLLSKISDWVNDGYTVKYVGEVEE